MNLDLAIFLVGLVLLGAGLLVIAYIWYFIIQRSPLKLIMMFMRTAMDRDRVIEDPNAPIEVPKDAHYSDVLDYEAQQIKAQGFMPDHIDAQVAAAHPVPKAVLPPDDLVQHGDTTTQSGWPVKLDKETSASPRPFLKIDYHTSNSDKPDPEPDNES